MSSGSSKLNIPFVTADQMREVDRAMVEDYGISLLQMMENAGRGLAHLARGRFLDGDPRGRRVLVLAGTGGNGGGGTISRASNSWALRSSDEGSPGTGCLWGGSIDEPESRGKSGALGSVGLGNGPAGGYCREVHHSSPR